MEISRTAAGLLVVGCLGAGASGAMLALKRGVPSPPTQAEAAAPATRATAVAESEAVIDEAPAPRPAPAAPQRAEPAKPAPRPAAPDGQRRTQPRPAPRAPETRPLPPVAREDAGMPAPIEPPVIADNRASQWVAPPGPVHEELVVAADSVVGLQLEAPVSSERAQLEDEVMARVTRDVRVGDRVAIPAGAKAFGEVTLVEQGGRMRERARLGVRFTSIVLADGTRLPISTETIYREGDPPGRESATKIGGGAIGGAIIGGILGGARGAAIGGSIGAGAGTAAVMAGGRNPATLSSGSPLTIRLEEPVVVTVERSGR